jgi:plasmid stabilization system protein ParE
MASRPLVRIHPEAVAEGIEAHRWYRERSSPAAREFKAALRRAVFRITDRPQAWPLVDAVHRRCPVGAFPFSMIYRELDAGRIEILAIAHAKRRPGYWRAR